MSQWVRVVSRHKDMDTRDHQYVCICSARWNQRILTKLPVTFRELPGCYSDWLTALYVSCLVGLTQNALIKLSSRLIWVIFNFVLKLGLPYVQLVCCLILCGMAQWLTCRCLCKMYAEEWRVHWGQHNPRFVSQKSNCRQVPVLKTYCCLHNKPDITESRKKPQSPYSVRKPSEAL